MSIRFLFAAAAAATALVAAVGATAAPTYKATGSIAGPDGGWDYATFDADTGGFIPSRGEVGDAREPLFSQLDARAQYTWTWTYWQLALYLDVQNVTNRTNEEFHVYDYRYRDQGSISGLPILPTFGVKGKF